MEDYSMGWLHDRPDFRDFDAGSTEIRPLVDQVKGLGKNGALPLRHDVSEFCSPIEDQRTLGSCTAQAGVALMEYFVNRSQTGEQFDGSRLFLYKVTRNLLGWTGDRGAFLRTTMGAMKLFGVPPERYYRYEIGQYDQEPEAFLYSLAQNFKAEKYFRLDPGDTDPKTVLKNIKQYLHAGFPSMFGFTVYSSYLQASNNGGKLPFPSTTNESAKGGHAVVAVGYDDEMEITNTFDGSKTKGALKIRNSWGAGWGQKGYGWLPYKYVLERQAVDFWTMISIKYVESGQFGI